MRFSMLLAASILLPYISASPIPSPSWHDPSTKTKHLSSETFRPYGTKIPTEMKKKLVSEVLEPEPWERFDGVYMGGKEQKLY